MDYKDIVLRRVDDLIYYWSIEYRERAQYIHVLRSLRESLIKVGLYEIASLIPEKVKHDQCGPVIDKLCQARKNAEH